MAKAVETTRLCGVTPRMRRVSRNYGEERKGQAGQVTPRMRRVSRNG